VKRLRHIWGEVSSFRNLQRAWLAARRGKRGRPDVSAFGLALEDELWTLRELLLDGSYRPGPYRQFTVYEKKPRVISAAPFGDRVVHHALMRVIGPPLDRRFIAHSYACRPDRGVHRAVAYYQSCARRWAYVVHLDVRQYFPSIDHEILKGQLASRIDDEDTLALLELIIGGSPLVVDTPRYYDDPDLFSALDRRRGIPVGNLTSQFFANLYLDDFDHQMVAHLRPGRYLRYVDDFWLLGDDAGVLREAVARASEWLALLRLSLHPGPPHVRRTSEKIPILGYQVSRERRWLDSRNVRRFARRLRRRKAKVGGDEVDLDASVQAWRGHALHGETQGLRRVLLGELC